MPIGTTFPEVLAAAQTGAGWAFAVLYEDLAPAVTGYLRLRGVAEPDGVASEIFIEFFHGLGNFRGDESALRVSVFTIARRRLVDDRRRPSLPGGGAGDSPSADGLCARLPDDQRDVLLLRILAGLTVEQVADVLGRTGSAVMGLQRRALTALQSEICDVSDLAASL